MVPPSSSFSREWDDPGVAQSAWVRGSLVGVVIGLTAIFVIAYRINPYAADGSAHRMGTHMQLGIPPCTFMGMTGWPCPSCGMTTSFALLVRGDVPNSLRANWVGTLLAGLGGLTIPWALAGIFLGRPLFLRSLEKTLLVIITTLVFLLSLRWAIQVCLGWGLGMSLE